MKHIYRLIIVLGISFLGELLHALIPLPIPASIYGLVLMFAALCLRLVPLEKISMTAHFLIEIMTITFIPAGVGLLTSWDVLRPVLIPFAVIMVVSTFAVMAVTGHVTQAVIRADRKREAKRS